jgi:transposase-like protein
MMNHKRRQWTAEERFQIIEEARQTDATVSEVCRRHCIDTGQFYNWEKLAREGVLGSKSVRNRGSQVSGAEWGAFVEEVQDRWENSRKSVYWF